MHTKCMSDSDGKFDIWEKSKFTVCPKCGGKVYLRVWNSSCGGYTDDKYICSQCNYKWWVDGDDG